MRLIIKSALLICALGAITSSCKKPVPNQTKHIPKTALFVATINTQALKSKLQENHRTIENIIRNVSGSDTALDKNRRELEDVTAAGIDLDENFYLSTVQKGAGMSLSKGTIVTTLTAKLEDKSKFETYIKKKFSKSEVRNENDYSYITSGGDKMIAWGKDLIICISYDKAFAGDMEYDSTTQSYNFKNPINAEADMKTEMAGYFKLKEDESVASIPEFRDLMQEKADMSFWMSSSSSIAEMALPLPQLKQLLSNSFTTATIDFKEGKIDVNSKSYYSKELSDLIKQYSGSSVNLDLVQNYPSNNINGFAAVSFNPAFFSGLVKYLEVGGVVDAFLTKTMGTEYTLQDALKAIKGDFAVIVSDFSLPDSDPSTAMGRSTMPKLRMILDVPVGDKIQMNRLMDKLVEMQMMVKTNNQYNLVPAMSRMGWQVSVDDKNLLVSSDEATLTQYRAKTSKAAINKDILNNFTGKSAVAYVNIESILNGVASPKTAEADSVVTKAKETFKDIEGYGEKFNGKYMQGHFEMRFKNEKQNSLTSFLSFIEVASKNVKRKQLQYDEEDVSADNSATMPAY